MREHPILIQVSFQDLKDGDHFIFVEAPSHYFAGYIEDGKVFGFDGVCLDPKFFPKDLYKITTA